MIAIGDTVPKIEMRTDEGTPLSLTDLAGRAVCVFLLGEAPADAVDGILDELHHHIDGFFDCEVSPVVVLSEAVEGLEKRRGANDMPFLLLSDSRMRAHGAFKGDDGGQATAWIVDAAGVVLDVIPMLPPGELVAVAEDRAAKAMTAKARRR